MDKQFIKSELSWHSIKISESWRFLLGKLQCFDSFVFFVMCGKTCMYFMIVLDLWYSGFCNKNGFQSWGNSSTSRRLFFQWDKLFGVLSMLYVDVRTERRGVRPRAMFGFYFVPKNLKSRHFYPVEKVKRQFRLVWQQKSMLLLITVMTVQVRGKGVRANPNMPNVVPIVMHIFGRSINKNVWIPGGVTLYVGITPCAFQFLRLRAWFLAHLRGAYAITWRPSSVVR
jgi:hypothetical protein